MYRSRSRFQSCHAGPLQKPGGGPNFRPAMREEPGLGLTHQFPVDVFATARLIVEAETEEAV